MKKLTVLLVFSVLSISSSFSQNKSYGIAISYGASIPIYHFSSKDVDLYHLSNNGKDGPGYANSGKMLDVSFTYKKTESLIGLSALFRNQQNSVDAIALKNQLTEQFANSSVTVDCRDWTVNTIMLGGYGDIRIINKINLNYRLMFGLVHITSPEWRITVQNNSGFEMIDQRLGSSFSFGMLIGAGIKYDLSKAVYLLANLDASGTQAEFLTSRTYEGSPVYYKTYLQTLATVNSSVGLGIRF